MIWTQFNLTSYSLPPHNPFNIVLSLPSRSSKKFSYKNFVCIAFLVEPTHMPTLSQLLNFTHPAKLGNLHKLRVSSLYCSLELCPFGASLSAACSQSILLREDIPTSVLPTNQFHGTVAFSRNQ